MLNEKPYIEIRGRRVGPGEPVFFIAEIGINHNGNPELARRLIDIAAEAGADAVKFQKRNLAQVYTPEVLEDLTTQDKELQYVVTWLQQAELSDDVFRELAEYAQGKNLEFLCSPWDRDSVDFLESLDLAAYKIASADLTNLPLLEYVLRTGKPLIVSTGMSDRREIQTTVRFLKDRGASFALLHCQSTYPAAFKDVNLRAMLALQEYGVPVGYSGHERGIAVSTAAVALGACIIERHVTLDRTMPGPDHAASLEPPGLQKQVRDIRILEIALGSDQRSMSRGEILTRHALGKSLAAAREIPAGKSIEWDDLTALSPGAGVSPQRALEIIGRPAPRLLRAGEHFRESDITGRDPAATAAAFAYPWGAVVRFHDCAALARELSPDLLEFHLTDMDLDAGLPADLPVLDRALAVHCPEYYHGRLLDLCSPDEDLRQWSVGVLERVLDLTRSLKEYFPESGAPVIVVHPGAMSFDGFVIDNGAMAEAFARSVEDIGQPEGVRVAYENLPPYPWYFGGQWYGNYFCAAEEVAEACSQLGIALCLDISHAQLWCRHAGADLAWYVETVRPWVAHLHVADASGVDGEGLQVGTGEVDFERVLPLLVSLGLPMVMEIWLGHHSQGEGFAVGLGRLAEIATKLGLPGTRR
ncbi:MAG: N-acetylneuraminate synthase family protein [Armatimonadetes bacterium]|nr:N-acetylneuraminate synthase family protein [Armatimonadota bacterium]